MTEKIKAFIEKYFIYLFAAAVVAINFTLIFDNVVWGDEAFSGNVIRGTNIAGLLQRIYYWDNHPPLYYILLQGLCAVLGHHTWVMHLLSFLLFAVGVVFAVVVWKKEAGWFPASMFVLVSGLSATCVEYNLEIRMYALVFLELFVCAYLSYRIISGDDRIRNFVCIVLFGVMAAYTHHYGLVTSGILLAVTFFGYFLRNKGKSWVRGVICLAAYIVLYLPWLFVLLKQMKGVAGSWWATEPSKLSAVLEFVFGGARLKPILLWMTVVLSLISILVDLGVLKLGGAKGKFELSLTTKDLKVALSDKTRGIMVLWAAVLLVLGFAYGISAVYKPILELRYMYPIVPLLLTILMLTISRVLDYAREQNLVKLFGVIFFVLFSVSLVFGLLDFKYFRSVTKTQNVETQKVLDVIGEVDDDTVMTSIAVQHLAWTVLEYYYPDTEIVEGFPTEAREDAGTVWSFYTGPLSDSEIESMQARGYNVEVHEDMWFGKYGCYIYKFYK